MSTTNGSRADQTPSAVTAPDRRLRIGYVVVQPYLFWDDGTELTPGPTVNSLSLSLTDLSNLADRLRVEVTRIAAENPG